MLTEDQMIEVLTHTHTHMRPEERVRCAYLDLLTFLSAPAFDSDQHPMSGSELAAYYAKQLGYFAREQAEIEAGVRPIRPDVRQSLVLDDGQDLNHPAGSPS